MDEICQIYDMIFAGVSWNAVVQAVLLKSHACVVSLFG